MNYLSIPVGVSNFGEIRKNHYYYIDKSGLISDLLKKAGTKVTLITRPRRFGKSLTVSILKAFFEGRKELFKGLAVYDKPHDRKNIRFFTSILATPQ